jgi:hypothetical protein
MCLCVFVHRCTSDDDDGGFYRTTFRACQHQGAGREDSHIHNGRAGGQAGRLNPVCHAFVSTGVWWDMCNTDGHQQVVCCGPCPPAGSATCCQQGSRPDDIHTHASRARGTTDNGRAGTWRALEGFIRAGDRKRQLTLLGLWTGAFASLLGVSSFCTYRGNSSAFSANPV